MSARRFAATVGLLLLPASLAAQLGGPDTPFGSRIVPREEVPQVGIAPEALAVPRRFIPFVVPLVLDTDGAQLGQLTAGVVLPNGDHPLSGRISYSRIDPEGADALDKFAVSVDGRILTASRVKVNLRGDIGDGDGLPQTLSAGLYGEGAIWRTQGASLSVGSDVKWSSSKGGGTEVDDIVMVPRLLLELGRLGLGYSYTLENDVTGEGTYSAEVNYSFPRFSALLGFVVGDNDTLALYLYKRF